MASAQLGGQLLPSIAAHGCQSPGVTLDLDYPEWHVKSSLLSVHLKPCCYHVLHTEQLILIETVPLHGRSTPTKCNNLYDHT